MLYITVNDCSGRAARKQRAPAVTRRKDIGQMRARPISFQREKRVQ